MCSPSRAAELSNLRAYAARLRGVLQHDLHSVLEQWCNLTRLARDLGGACTLCAHLALVYKHVDEAELDYQAVSTLLCDHVYFGNNDYGIFCAYAGRRRAQVCCSGDPPSPHRGPCKRLAIDRTPCASCSSPCVRLRRVRCFRYALYTPCHVLSFRIPYILYSNQ